MREIYRNLEELFKFGVIGHNIPNWCVGTLKVHGKIENIKKWIEEGIVCYDMFWNTTEKQPNVDYKFVDLCVEIPEEGHVKGSRRNFISGEDYVYEGENRVYGTLCFDIRAAWGFEPDVYKKISEDYNLDFRLQGFEQGMEFEQILEVINGEITIDEERHYADYKWEAYDPRLGG